jgi:hypothetical protein
MPDETVPLETGAPAGCEEGMGVAPRGAGEFWLMMGCSTIQLVEKQPSSEAWHPSVQSSQLRTPKRSHTCGEEEGRRG